MTHKYRISFQFALSIFFLVFAIVFGTFIYWKEDSMQDSIIYFEVLRWQIWIWIPWLVFIQGIARYQNLQNYQRKKRFMLMAVTGILFITFHFGWFFIISKNFSPYLGAPATKYGVYPYFFIFWTTIDVFILTGLILYLELFMRETHVVTGSSSSGKILVRRGNTDFVLSSSDINWIASNGYYADLHTGKGQFLLRKPLKTLMEQLPVNKFLRIHRSTIINIMFIARFQRLGNGSGIVYFKDGDQRIISRRYLKNLKDTLKEFSFNR